MISVNLSRLMLGAVMLAMASLVLSGCVTSDVTRFYDLQALKVGKSFIVLPFDKQKGNLEFKKYASLISNHLKAVGYRAAQNEKQADYVIFFDYGIDDGRTVVGSRPVFGSTGGGATRHSGTVSHSGGGSSTYSGTSHAPASYGVVGSQTYSSVAYTRFLTLDMIDSKKSSQENIVKVFEGKVKSTGNSNSFANVGGCLIHSLFKGFPGKNGESIRTTLSANECVVSAWQWQILLGRGYWF